MKEDQVVIVSLGQLVASDVDASIAEFSRLCDSKGYFASGIRVQAALAWDAIWHKTIDDYKLGNITNWNTFQSRIVNQLGMDLTSAEVKQAWNAMCKINTHMIGELQQLAALQQEQGFKLVIASTTNAEQYSFIQNLLQQNNIVFDPNNTFYGLSHLEQTLNNKTLAERGLNAAGVDINTANILSLHNAIPIGTQIPTDTRKASLTQAICGHFNYRDKGLVELDLEKEDEGITLIPQQTTGKFVAQVQKQRQEAKTNCCGCTLF